MYNEAIKTEFFEAEKGINDFKKARGWLFDTIEPYEREIGKDIAEMTTLEAIAALEHSGLEEISTVRQAISAMRDYTEWCNQKGYYKVAVNGFAEINIDDIDFSDTFKKILIKDDAALIDDLRTVGQFDSGHIDVLVFLFSWLGLFRDEMIALRDKDVDLDHRIIYGADGQPIATGFSDSVTDILLRYRKCQESTRQNGLRVIKVFKDNSVDSFFKRMCSENSKKFGTEYKVKQLEVESSRLAKRFEEAGRNPRRLTMANTWRSGCLYRLWQMEQETGLDMGNLKRRDYIEKAFRKKKNYTNTARMYRWYKKVFWE